jgi:preprotein translocase subunit YajC
VEALGTLLPFILIAVVFWFLLIRPQRRRQMEIMATQRGVEIGDEVVLSAGIVGRVATTSDEFLELEISPGVLMKVARGAVVRVLHPEEPIADDAPATGFDDATDPTDPNDPSRDH